MGLDNIQQYYKQRLLKESSVGEKAEREAREEGFDDFSHDEASGMRRAKKIMEAIQRKESYTEALDDKFEESIEKGTSPYGPRDTAAVATAQAKRLYGVSSFGPDSRGAAIRDTIAQGIDAKHGPGSYGKANWKQADAASLGKKGQGSKKAIKSMLKGFPPALASLMSAAAGWALSGDVGKVGQMTPEQSREWERTLSAAERRNLERTLRSQMRRKSADTSLNKDAFESLKAHYEDSTDTYIQRTPIINMLEKEHSSIPPRQGLQWDAIKHRWTRPENIGHTVTEVQGKKRIRGTGTGAHERSVGGHGSGKVRGMEAGRRFKGASDSGIIRPHQSIGIPKRKASKK